MSLTMQTFVFLKNSIEFFRNRTFQKYFIFSLSFFLAIGFFLNSYSIHSQDVYYYDVQEMYVEVDEFSTSSSGVDGKHSHKAQGFQMADFTSNMLDVLYPQANSNYASIVQNPNISPMSKLGVVGMVDVPLSALLYNPPYVDIPEHLAQEWIPNYDQSSAGIYAQDSGYDQLMGSGIVDLWRLARNIAYMFFVVVFIIAGFMIMFRHKLGGQTMVTVYNTLPSIVVGLILVTFSFAIVGFIIDIGALFIRVVDGVLAVDGTVDPTSPIGIWKAYSGNIIGYSVTRMLTLELLPMILAFLIIPGFRLVAGLIGGFLLLTLVIVILYASIKVFFTLVKAYIGILFNAISSPLVFAVATIPGRQAVMKDWFNSVVKNVLVFVLVFILVNLPIYFMKNGMEFDLFSGDLGSGRGQASAVTVIIMTAVSIYMLFLAANVPKMLDEYFPKPQGGTGAAGAEGAKKDLSKIPLLGGFFKG